MPPLVLASASPRRRELLERAGYRFEIVVPDVAELDTCPDGPAALVRRNAARKAAAVADLRPDAVVLGADTTVFLGDDILNKPADAEHARRMLRMLSGREHGVVTAFVLEHRATGRRFEEVVESCVTFRPLDEAAITAYVETARPFDKAGAYAIQDGVVVAGHTGSYTNIVGLPLEAVEAGLRAWGIAPTVPAA